MLWLEAIAGEEVRRGELLRLAVALLEVLFLVIRERQSIRKLTLNLAVFYGECIVLLGVHQLLGQGRDSQRPLVWGAAMLSVFAADMLGFIVWSSLFAVPPLLALSLLVEGPQAILHALPRAGWATWSAVAWQTVGNTLFGFGAWGWLMARHPAAAVTPMALLVPVFGMGASALLLAEPLPLWKLAAASMVMGGLGLSVFSARRARTAA